MLCNKRQTQATLLLLKRRKTKIIYISKRKYDLQRERNSKRKRCFLLSVLPMLRERKALEHIKLFLCIKPKNTTSKMEIKELNVTFNKGSTENAFVLFMAIVLLGITDLWLYIKLRFSNCPSRSGSNCI